MYHSIYNSSNTLITDKNDQDSMASKREAVAKAERAFKIFDKDNDGYITKEEFTKISKKLNKQQVQYILLHSSKRHTFFIKVLGYLSCPKI